MQNLPIIYEWHTKGIKKYYCRKCKHFKSWYLLISTYMQKISSQFMQNIWWWYNCLEITREFYTQLYVDCSGIRLAVRKMCRTWNTLCHILFCRKRSILRVVCAVVCRLLWHEAGSQEDVSARSNNGSVTTSGCKCKNRKVDLM